MSKSSIGARLMLITYLWVKVHAFNTFVNLPNPFNALITERRDGSIDAKKEFLDSLDSVNSFNPASKTRTNLLDTMTNFNPTEKPGSTSSFLPIAPGTWKIVYAPHISTLSGLINGSFNPVIYDMKKDGMTIVSHAKYNFPILGEGWLSVSGTYGTEDNDTRCRVDFEHAWIRIGAENWASYNDAPNTWYKGPINELGKLGFRKEFAVFPVSYLDKDTIVFDFELFGTRICARKM